MSGSLTNHQKITREFCKGKTLLFFPDTHEEAELIQRKIFALGYAWCAKSEYGATIHELQGCVEKGMVLADCVLFSNPVEESRRSGILCHISQFDDADPFQQEPGFMEKFNALAQRVEKMEALIEAIYREVMPKEMEGKKPIKLNSAQPE